MKEIYPWLLITYIIFNILLIKYIKLNLSVDLCIFLINEHSYHIRIYVLLIMGCSYLCKELTNWNSCRWALIWGCLFCLLSPSAFQTSKNFSIVSSTCLSYVIWNTCKIFNYHIMSYYNEYIDLCVFRDGKKVYPYWTFHVDFISNLWPTSKASQKDQLSQRLLTRQRHNDLRFDSVISLFI